MRPQYVVLHQFQCGQAFYCQEVCIWKFESLGIYDLEETFKTDLETANSEPLIYYRRKRFLYKLKPGFEPL